MKILNALDLKNVEKAKHNRLWSVSQPLQFLPTVEKDEQWAAWNMDWLEWNGLKQLRRNARRLMKNLLKVLLIRQTISRLKIMR